MLRAVDADGVIAETTLRAELQPRVVAAAKRVLGQSQLAHAATPLERACWARVQQISGLIEADSTELALGAVAAFERWAEGVLW